MTPADEATFCALWQQGLSQDAIAQRLGIPIGTVKSRAHALAHAGKLTPRPRGGAYPSQRAKAQQGGGAGVPQVGPMDVLPPERAPGYAIIPLDVVHTILQRFDRLEEHLHIVAGQVPHGGAGRGAGQVPQEETRVLRPCRSTRWKMSIREALLEVIRTEAEQRRMDPSKLVQEAIEAWLHVQTPER
jgi:hypothetical protein